MNTAPQAFESEPSATTIRNRLVLISFHDQPYRDLLADLCDGEDIPLLFVNEEDEMQIMNLEDSIQPVFPVSYENLNESRRAFLRNFLSHYKFGRMIVMGQKIPYQDKIEFVSEWSIPVLDLSDHVEPQEREDRIRSYLRKVLRDIEKPFVEELNDSSLRRKLEWSMYRESRIEKYDNLFGEKTIENLRISLSQGAGFGLILSLIDLLDETKAEDGEIIKLIKDNGKVARKTLDGLEDLVRLMTDNFSLDVVLTTTLIGKINAMLNRLIGSVQERRVIFTTAGNPGEHRLKIDTETVLLAIQELCINAIKYSRTGSGIGLFYTIQSGYFIISIMNKVDVEPYGGIPEESQESVMDPFYRIHPPVEDIIWQEKFGLGLGLTAVKNILSRHHGFVKINNVNDYTGASPSLAVLASAYLPLQDESL